jgi:hypothetical protein
MRDELGDPSSLCPVSEVVLDDLSRELDPAEDQARFRSGLESREHAE